MAHINDPRVQRLIKIIGKRRYYQLAGMVSASEFRTGIHLEGDWDGKGLTVAECQLVLRNRDLFLAAGRDVDLMIQNMPKTTPRADLEQYGRVFVANT